MAIAPAPVITIANGRGPEGALSTAEGGAVGCVTATWAGASRSGVTVTVAEPPPAATSTVVRHGCLWLAEAVIVWVPGSTGRGAPHWAAPTATPSRWISRSGDLAPSATAIVILE